MTLVLTERCNFSCPYCQQLKGKNTLKIDAIKVFLNFLQPQLEKEVWLGFYGGEPLLAWPLIEKTVAYLRKNRKSKFHFSLTTNGSLLKEGHILFLKENSFKLLMSYDGLAQFRRDKNSVSAVEKALKSLQKLYPQGYAINSVFTPATVSLLADSMTALMKQGHQRLQYTLDLSVPWLANDLLTLANELDRLAEFGSDHFQKNGRRPLLNFNSDAEADSKGVFACFAGRDRLALLPDNTVWGCYLFYDLLGHAAENPDYEKYCFGKLPGFIGAGKKNRTVAANYHDLRQDYFFTAKKNLCSLCPELEYCSICPVVAALATSCLGIIPDWVCRIRQVNDKIHALIARSN